jgi:hypothetical protein
VKTEENKAAVVKMKKVKEEIAVSNKKAREHDEHHNKLVAQVILPKGSIVSDTIGRR